VHVNLRTINPCSRVERPLSIPICVPVMSPPSVKVFSGYQAFKNRPVSTLSEEQLPAACQQFVPSFGL